jgi:hypothetical protein
MELSELQDGAVASRWMALALCLSAFLLFLAPPAHAAIYWGNGPPIGRANLDGTNAEPDFIRPGPTQGGQYTGCGGVAVNATHVYWADPLRDAIGRANLDGSAPNYSFVAGADNPCGIALDGAYVYWANFEGHSIGRARLDGTEVTQTLLGASTPCGLATDSRFLYWANADRPYVGRVLLVAPGGGGPHLLDGNSDDFDFCGLAASDTHVFWGGFGDAIGRVKSNGADPEPSFIAPVYRPCGLAVDADRIYWLEQRLPYASIGSADLDGSGVNRSVLTGLSRYPCGIAVDSIVVPPPPPDPLPTPRPLPVSRFGFGTLKHAKRRWSAFIAIKTPDYGPLRVKSRRGVRWRILPARGAAMTQTGMKRRWVKVWPAARGRAGRRIRERIRRTGKAPILIRVEYTATGHASIGAAKRFSLLSRRAGRR